MGHVWHPVGGSCRRPTGLPPGRPAGPPRGGRLPRRRVRPADGVDLGLWTCPHTSELVIPLDVHVVRVGQCLGLTGHERYDLILPDRLVPGATVTVTATAATNRMFTSSFWARGSLPATSGAR